MYPSQATSPGGGWVTTSDLSVTVTEHDRQKTVSCYAINAELGETIVESKVVSVICEFYHINRLRNHATCRFADKHQAKQAQFLIKSLLIT